MKPGDRLGHFELDTPLGQGGMGEVWRARDRVLGRSVAIKVLPKTLRNDIDAIMRFRREARALAAINHPSVAQVFELEACADPEDKDSTLRFIVMELVEGETLQHALARGPLGLERTLDVARQLILALQSAHAQGIIHRDLKPGNVMLTAEGTVKVLDFGLAGFKPKARAGDPNVTWEQPDLGIVVGTPAYMAPEQIRGEEASEASDIWAFGCVVAELLSGERLVPGNTLPEIVGHALAGKLAWETLPPRTPRRLRRLLKRCCAPDPDSRPSSERVLRELTALQRRKAVSRRLAVAAAMLVAGAAVSRVFFPPAAPPLLDGERRLPVSVVGNTSGPSSEGETVLLNRLAEKPFLAVVAPEKAAVLVSVTEDEDAATVTVTTREGKGRRELAELRAPSSERAFLADRVTAVLEREHIRRDAMTDDTVFGFLADRATNLEAMRLFRDGVRLYLRTRHAEAQQLLTRALEVDRQFWPAHLLLALLAKATARFPEAQEHLAEARRLCPQPTTPEAALLEASAALVAEDAQRADEALARALALFPTSGYLRYRLALTYRLQDQPEKAIPLAKKLIKQGWMPDFSPLWELLAHCQLLAHRPASALETCQAAQKRFPTRYRHWLYAAYAHHLLGEDAAARKSLEDALRKYLDYGATPKLTAYQFGMYWAWLLRWPEKREAMAAAILSEVARLLEANPADPEAQLAQADALLALKRPHEALPLLAALAQEQDPAPYVFLSLSRAYAAVGRLAASTEALTRAEAAWREGHGPARGTLAYNIAAAWASLGETEKALLWLSRAKELYGFDRLDLLLDPDLDPLRRRGLLRQFQ